MSRKGVHARSYATTGIALRGNGVAYYLGQDKVETPSRSFNRKVMLEN
jgi:hypothetical protein